MALWTRFFLASIMAVSLLIALDAGRLFLDAALPRQLPWFLAQTAVLIFALAGLFSGFAILFHLIHGFGTRGALWLWIRLSRRPASARATGWVNLAVWILLWLALAQSYLSRIATDVQVRPGFLRLDWFASVQPWIFAFLFVGFALFAGFVGLSLIWSTEKGEGKRNWVNLSILTIVTLFLYLDGFFLVGYYHLYHRVIGLLTLVLLGVLGNRVLTANDKRSGHGFFQSQGLAIALAGISTLSLGVVFSGALFRSPSHVDTILFDTTYLRRIAIEFREASDGDSDGFSRLFGGEDSDDGNAAIHPLAIDVPDDGIDQDGDGRDWTAAEASALESRLLRSYGTRPEALPTVDRVLFITVDAIRQDRIGALASDMRPSCPAISRFAGTAIQFQNAYSPTSATVGTFRSILTASMYVPDSSQSVLAFLDSNGVYTAMIAPTIAINYLTTFGSVIQKGREIVASETLMSGEDPLRGKVHLEAPTSQALTDSAIVVVARSPTPSFFWIHYYDLHQWSDLDLEDRRLSLEDVDRYDETLRLVDEEVGRLLEELESRELLENTAILISADHGESLGERGILGHGFYVWEPFVRVPLLLKLPGVDGRDIKTPVSLLSIGATVAELLGFHFESDGGPSMLPLLEMEAHEPVVLFLDELEQVAVIEGEWKLIYGGEDRRFQLFNLQEDPRERVNLVEEERERFLDLKRLLVSNLYRQPYLFRYGP